MRTQRTFSVAAAAGAVLGLALTLPCGAQPSGGPTTVGAGNARFEFLTPTLVRLEYSAPGAFVDAPTAVIEKRDWAAVKVDSREQDGWLSATTGALTVRYRLRSGAFTAANLEVRWQDRAGAERSWHPGDVDAGNLGGLNYSLDNIRAANLPRDGMDLESPVDDSIPGIDLVLPRAQPGLLSRNGYASSTTARLRCGTRSAGGSSHARRRDRTGISSLTTVITAAYSRSTPSSAEPFR